SASLRGLPGPVGFAPGCVNPAGPGCAGTWGTTGEYGGYCGGGIWVCVCSYHSGAVGCDPSSGGRCDQGSCDAGCWLGPSGPVVAGGVPSAGGDQGGWDAGRCRGAHAHGSRAFRWGALRWGGLRWGGLRGQWWLRWLLRHGNLLGSIRSSQSHERQTMLGADWEFAVGSSTTKVAPPPGVGATPTGPSWALTMAATMARPRPLPPPWPRPRE